MSIARSGLLRATITRRVKTDGPSEIFMDRLALPVGRIVQVKQPAASSKERPEGVSDKFYRTGAIVQMTTESSVEIDDRVAFIEYPAFLHEFGLVSGPTILSTQHQGPIVFNLLVTKDVDLGDVGPVNLYFEGQ